jgi:hypothetical protein
VLANYLEDAKMQKEYGIGANGQVGGVNMGAYSESPMSGDLAEDFNPSLYNLKVSIV